MYKNQLITASTPICVKLSSRIWLKVKMTTEAMCGEVGVLGIQAVEVSTLTGKCEIFIDHLLRSG